MFFSIALILTIALYTSIATRNATISATTSAIDESYFEQDMQYDLQYLTYLALLIDGHPNHNQLEQYLKDNNSGINFIIVRGGEVYAKHPNSFFPLPHQDYATISKNKPHPYQGESYFKALASDLGVSVVLPKNIKTASFGRWEENYSADCIETHDGYRYYIISDYLLEDDYEDSLNLNEGPRGVFTWGLFIGIGFILVFVALTYNYIRIRLKPIQLMKKRLQDLERGDLESTIKILGKDELAELSISFNRLISEIKALIDQKHRLLLDVSHELKSPLARMLLLIEMIPENNKHIQELREEISFLNDMISNLLLTDKLDIPYSQLDLQKINHLEFFNKIVGFFNQDQQSKVNITSRLNKDIIWEIDLTKMIICIKNIVQNAFKYANTEQGIKLTIEETEKNYKISIIDFGAGISEEDQKHIFDSFYRSKNVKRVSGFGLGLSISKKIIKAHRGTITVISKAEEGSTFVVTLPKENKNDK